MQWNGNLAEAPRCMLETHLAHRHAREAYRAGVRASEARALRAEAQRDAAVAVLRGVGALVERGDIRCVDCGLWRSELPHLANCALARVLAEVGAGKSGA
jgi:hypothetical protein